MKTDTLNKIMLAFSLAAFLFNLYLYISYYEFSFIMSALMATFGGVSVGSAICFAGMLLAGKSKKTFGWSALVQLLIYFVMSLAAPLTVLISGSNTVQIDFVGLLSIPAVIAVMVLLFKEFYGRKPISKKAGFITAAAVTVIFAGLAIKSCIGAQVIVAVNTILQNLLIAALAWYSVWEKANEKV